MPEDYVEMHGLSERKRERESLPCDGRYEFMGRAKGSKLSPLSGLSLTSPPEPLQEASSERAPTEFLVALHTSRDKLFAACCDCEGIFPDRVTRAIFESTNRTKKPQMSLRGTRTFSPKRNKLSRARDSAMCTIGSCYERNASTVDHACDTRIK